MLAKRIGVTQDSVKSAGMENRNTKGSNGSKAPFSHNEKKKKSWFKFRALESPVYISSFPYSHETDHKKRILDIDMLK